MYRLKYHAVALALLFLSLSCPACGKEGGTEPSGPEPPCSPKSPGSRNSPERLVVEIADPGFEQEVDFTSGAWKKTHAWQTDRAVFSYEPTGGYNGSAGIRIACVDGDYTTDAVVTQPVSGLVPGKLYELSAMVRTSGVTAAGAVTSACSVRASGSARRPSWVPTAGRAAACSSSPKRRPPSSGAA